MKFEQFIYRILFTGFLSVASASLSLAAETRTWKSADGRSIEAEMAEDQGEAVVLKRGDGPIVTVRLDQLSELDRKWVIEQRGAAALEAGSIPSIKPLLGEPGKLLIHETFSTKELPSQTSVAHGFWTIEEGCLKGVEDLSEEHSAIFSIGPDTGDATIELRFQCVGKEAVFELGFNRADGTGHMLRIRPTPQTLTVFKEKPKNDPNASFGLVAKEDFETKPDEWHTLLVEVRGEKVAVQIDGKVAAEGSHPGMVNRKAPYRFVVDGDHVLIDDVKIWASEAE